MVFEFPIAIFFELKYLVNCIFRKIIIMCMPFFFLSEMTPTEFGQKSEIVSNIPSFHSCVLIAEKEQIFHIADLFSRKRALGLGNACLS